MGELIVKRLEATQRLQQNPQDMEAQQMLNYVEHQHQVHITDVHIYTACPMYAYTVTSYKSILPNIPAPF